MKNPIAAISFGIAITFVSAGSALAEVAVVVGADGNTVVGGPFVSSIIEDPDPINLLVWNPYAPASGTRILLNENGSLNGDGRPAVGRNSVSGLPFVIWAKNNGTSFDIVESHFAEGSWTEPAIIAASVGTTFDPEPSVAIDQTTGAVHVVYSCNDTTPAVMHSQALSDLASWSQPTLVSQLAENALRPSAVFLQSSLVVAYESHGSSVGSTPRQIVVATSDGFGGFTYQAVTSTHFGDPNRPELHVGIGDSMWLDWVDSDDVMAWTSWQGIAGWGPVQSEMFSGPGDRDYHVRNRIKHLANP